MEWVRDYLISIVAAAVICAVMNAVVEKNSLVQASVKLLTGIFMAITVVSPLVKLEISDFTEFYGSIQADADAWVDSGEEYAQSEMYAFIKEQAQAYILDKADSLGIELQVEVFLSEGGEPIPWSVNLCGETSPYAREQLSQYIANNLGIPKERQSWN